VASRSNHLNSSAIALDMSWPLFLTDFEHHASLSALDTNRMPPAYSCTRTCLSVSRMLMATDTMPSIHFYRVCVNLHPSLASKRSSGCPFPPGCLLWLDWLVISTCSFGLILLDCMVFFFSVSKSHYQRRCDTYYE
jgi:hypothetical protein